MEDSRPVKSVAPDHRPARARSTPASPFADALARGLIDTAFAFDGSLRAVASLSLADRSAYGIRAPHPSFGTCVANVPCSCILLKAERVPQAAHLVKRSVGYESLSEIRSGTSATQPRSSEPIRSIACLRITRGKTPHVPPRPFFRAILRAGATVIHVLVVRGRTFLSLSAWTR